MPWTRTAGYDTGVRAAVRGTCHARGPQICEALCGHHFCEVLVHQVPLSSVLSGEGERAHLNNRV